MSAGSFPWRRLRIPWGAKKKITESKLPKVSANYVAAQSRWYTAVSRNLEVNLRSSQQQRLLWNRNPMR